MGDARAEVGREAGLENFSLRNISRKCLKLTEEIKEMFRLTQKMNPSHETLITAVS